MFNSNEGFAQGNPDGGSWRYWITTNGGASWSAGLLLFQQVVWEPDGPTLIWHLIQRIYGGVQIHQKFGKEVSEDFGHLQLRQGAPTHLVLHLMMQVLVLHALSQGQTNFQEMEV